MPDHIELWSFRVGTINMPVDPHWPAFGTPPLCKEPDADKILNEKYTYGTFFKAAKKFKKWVHFFWRTDRELTNCLKCLATLREMEP